MEKKCTWPAKLITIVFIPLLFFALVELALRIAGVDTDVVKSRRLKIVTPVWAANDINFFATRGIYQGIIANTMPPRAADWMRYFEEAPYVRYRMKPEIAVRIFNTVNRKEIKKGKKIFVRSNASGFRSDELPKEKGKNVFRIVFLGDSATFGWGVNQDERFSDLLVQRLNGEQQRIRYEAINLGIPGYTSHHGLSAFVHFALPYSPDLVVCSFGANDGKPISRQAKALLQKESRMEELRFFLMKFKTYRLLRKWTLQLANPFDRISLPDKPEETEPVVTPGEFQRNLETLVRTARARNMGLAMLPLCCPVEYWQRMLEVSLKEGIPFINGMGILNQGIADVRDKGMYPELTAAVRELYGERTLAEAPLLYTTNDTCHPNALGHRLIADALHEKLFSRAQPLKQVPGGPPLP